MVYEVNVFKELLMRLVWVSADCADMMNDLTPIEDQMRICKDLLDMLDTLSISIPDLYIPTITSLLAEITDQVNAETTNEINS